MVMLRPPGKVSKIAKKVLKREGVKIPKRDVIKKKKFIDPSLSN